MIYRPINPLFIPDAEHSGGGKSVKASSPAAPTAAPAAASSAAVKHPSGITHIFAVDRHEKTLTGIKSAFKKEASIVDGLTPNTPTLIHYPPDLNSNLADYLREGDKALLILGNHLSWPHTGLTVLESCDQQAIKHMGAIFVNSDHILSEDRIKYSNFAKKHNIPIKIAREKQAYKINEVLEFLQELSEKTTTALHAATPAEIK